MENPERHQRVMMCHGRWTTGNRRDMKASSAYPKHFGLAVRRSMLAWEDAKDGDLSLATENVLQWTDRMLADLPPPGQLAHHDTWPWLNYAKLLHYFCKILELWFVFNSGCTIGCNNTLASR